MEILEGLLAGLRAVCQKFPDARRGKVDYSMVDIGLSAFSMFFMQHESFLSFQRRMEESHGASNCPPLFGIKAIPSYNHIRMRLAQVSPESFQPCFASGAGGNLPARRLKAIRATGRSGSDCARW